MTDSTTDRLDWAEEINAETALIAAAENQAAEHHLRRNALVAAAHAEGRPHIDIALACGFRPGQVAQICLDAKHSSYTPKGGSEGQPT